MADLDTITGFLDGYLAFLKEKSSEVRINENVSKISLPFLDALDDCTEIYIINDNDKYIITDDGETLTNLKFNGVEISSPSRQKIFERILSNYGVKVNDNNSLYIEAIIDNLYLKKHMFLQCVAKINDMYVLSRNNVQNIFLEDVKNFLEKNKILNVPDYKIIGKSGLTSNYDFVIPKTDKKPMTLLRVVNKIDRDKVKSIVFDWTDSIGVVQDDLQLLVIYNDTENQIREENVNALKTCGVKSFAWTQNQQLKEYLMAS